MLNKLLVYGVVKSCEFFCYTLNYLAILHLYTFHYKNRVVGIFSNSSTCMATISNSKWPIYRDALHINGTFHNLNYE